MKWEKRGLIFPARGVVSWAEAFALQPTPLVLEDRVRVFAGMRDVDGVSRIARIDLDLDDPEKVLGISERPVLDVGTAGAFDEFGVVPSAVVQRASNIFMFYAGYQRGLRARFTVFGGLAVSHDRGNSFVRVRKTPVFERTDRDLLFRVPHSVLEEGGRFRFWYGGGDHFVAGKEKTLPVYDVRYLESTSLTDVPREGLVCVRTGGEEHRVGRPYVIRRDGGYLMFYGYGTEHCPYQLGMARSPDGRSWTRCDEELRLPLSASGWDSTMMAYPAFFESRGRGFLLYNGNDFGVDGFGLANLVSWQ